MTLNEYLFFRVVPQDQSFSDKYAGIFYFRFWRYGHWVDVVIDDRLPTLYGNLVFLHSTENNEFWSALLEKAYAKLHGSYEALRGGTASEAMEDFTGGVTEIYELTKVPQDFFQILLKAYERSSLMAASVEPDPNIVERQTPEGLVTGHVYSVTKVQYIISNKPTTNTKIPLLRLRNPWGNATEWKGAWSDTSPEWTLIPDSEKEEIGLTFEADGEFWISFTDIVKYFLKLEICNLSPESLTDEVATKKGKKRWEMSVFEGEWVRGITAGGCNNHLATFAKNPQYTISLSEPDDGDADEDNDKKCTIIISLMQKNRRAQRRIGSELLLIGFAVYKLENPENQPKPLDTDFFKYNGSKEVATSSFINLREVNCRFKLPPGTYCIIPSTFYPNEDAEFLLRVFSEKKNYMKEHDEEVGLDVVDTRIVNAEPKPEVKEADEKIIEFFKQFAGEDREVDWRDLSEILNYAMRNEKAGEGGFSKDVCRSMIAMIDVNHSGKLDFEEFKQLWTDIRHWQNVFKMYNKDGSGYLTGFELREALNSAGYRLNNHILNSLGHRYASKDGKISFDDFIMCAIRLKIMIDQFKERDPDATGTATFSMEEWLQKTLYS